MKIEIDTNKDSYESWKKAKELIESLYCTKETVQPLNVEPGGKESGTSKSRYTII